MFQVLGLSDEYLLVEEITDWGNCCTRWCRQFLCFFSIHIFM